jgi:hypothetical protein
MNAQLTPKQFTLMNAIVGGADIWSPVIARDLRQMQRIVPGYLWVGPAMMADDIPGNERQPYFGTCLTAEGKRALDAYKETLSVLTTSNWGAMKKAERGCTGLLDSRFGTNILEAAARVPEYVLVRVNSIPPPPPNDDIDSAFDAEDYSTVCAILTEAGCQALAFHENRNRL